MTIEAVVFDMDGVLIDSEVLWQRVREDFAAERGLPWRQQDQEALMGCSTEVWSVRMCERLALTDISPAELATDILGRVQRAFETHLPVRPGAAEVLAALGQRWPLALATGSPRELADCALRLTGFGKHFQATVCGDEVRHGKPHPEIYQRAVAALGVAPSRAAGIEDSANGLRALRAAGLWAIAAPGEAFPLLPAELALGHAVVQHLSAITPDFVAALPRAGSAA